MPRQLRIEYPGAIYHVMSRGDRREDIFYDDVDRHDFVKTLAEACQKTGFQVHAYCLMPNHFHLVLETPNANLVAGMRWLLSNYTLRLNHRRKLFGHVFGGRYKALIVEPGHRYLKTVCDYVHLNPVRARLLRRDDPLRAYPWTSMTWHLTVPEHRPVWIRSDRLLGAHGLRKDTAQTRAEFEARMETRRRSGDDEQEWKPLRRGWCLGSEEFKKQMLAKIEEQLGEHHSGALKQESAEMKAERIIAEELKRLGWSNSDLFLRLKGDPAKMTIALRLRKETTLTLKQIAERLSLGSAKSARMRFHKFIKSNPTNANERTFL